MGREVSREIKNSECKLSNGWSRSYKVMKTPSFCYEADYPLEAPRTAKKIKVHSKVGFSGNPESRFKK